VAKRVPFVLAQWARVVGLQQGIAHLKGCAGCVLPTRVLLIDLDLEDAEERITELLRMASARRAEARNA